MNNTSRLPIPKKDWVNIIFFTITTLVGIIGAPLYIIQFGFQSSVFWLFVFYVAMTGFGITVGYHRFYAHRTYKASKFIEFLILFFGAASFEQSALKWSSQHRDHHRFVDTDKDPYSIKRGFFYAHIGWLISWKHHTNYENSKDIQNTSLAMHQHKYFLLWSLGAGIVLPLVIGALTGHLLGAFIFSVCLRLTVVYHSTFFINSICHMFGKSLYDIHATAKDNRWIAFLTFGEGYHNFHHRFPTDYRNGVRWYDWDPSKWIISGLAKLGLTSSLKRTSKFRILEAKLAAENEKAKVLIQNKKTMVHFEKLEKQLAESYAAIRTRLLQWEETKQEYQKILSLKQTEMKHSTRQKLKEAKKIFYETKRTWQMFHSKPLELMN